MEFKEPKIIKTFFILEKRNSVFHQKIDQKNQILFSNRRLMPVYSTKPKPTDHHRNPSPLEREREREREKTTIEPVTNKTTKPRHSRQQRNDPAARSKKKRTRKAKTPADSSDHHSQRNRPDPRC